MHRLLVVVIFFAVRTVLSTCANNCALFLLLELVSTFFPLPVIWYYNSASSAVLDEKLRSRANGCEKLLSRTTVCVPQLIVKVKCKLMATLKLTLLKSGIPLSLLK